MSSDSEKIKYYVLYLISRAVPIVLFEAGKPLSKNEINGGVLEYIKKRLQLSEEEIKEVIRPKTLAYYVGCLKSQKMNIERSGNKWFLNEQGQIYAKNVKAYEEAFEMAPRFLIHPGELIDYYTIGEFVEESYGTLYQNLIHLTESLNKNYEDYIKEHSLRLSKRRIILIKRRKDYLAARHNGHLFYYPQFIISLCAQLEFTLNQLCQLKEHRDVFIPLKGIQGKGATRAEVYLEKILRIELPKKAYRENIKNLTELRNLLVHAGGEIDLKEKSILKYLEQNKSIYIYKDKNETRGLIQLSHDYCEKALNDVLDYLNELGEKIMYPVINPNHPPYYLFRGDLTDNYFY